MSSKKVPWAKKMNAILDHEKKLWDAAMKMADGQKVDVTLPKDKGGVQKPKNIQLFAGMIEDAKVERQRRIERERKRKAKLAAEDNK